MSIFQEKNEAVIKAGEFVAAHPRVNIFFHHYINPFAAIQCTTKSVRLLIFLCPKRQYTVLTYLLTKKLLQPIALQLVFASERQSLLSCLA